jgi:hypothetical protein
MAKSTKNFHYHKKFPPYWVQMLKDELAKELSGYSDFSGYLPPVKEHSIIGTLAGKLPSKPQGITIGGTIYYTPRYPVVKERFRAAHGGEESLIYEFGMYAHETFHAIDQEVTKRLRILDVTVMSGKVRWFTKYILKLLKTPNAKTHPMEIPAYQFQKYLKTLARANDTTK